jgi:eukaryotic-like serine/threonine-protein kinase
MTTSKGALYSAAQSLLNQILRRLGKTGPLIASSPPFAPKVSVALGTAGIAFALYRIACLREDRKLLTRADIWATQAAKAINEDQAFYSAEIGITPDVVARISPYYTASGLQSVRALIAHARGDVMSMQAGLDAFVSAVSEPSESFELIVGRPGVLLIGALLLETLASAPLGDTAALIALGNEVLRDVWEEIDCLPPILEGSKIKYSGMAVGWAGILYATIRWCLAAGISLPPAIGERLRQLAEAAEEVGRGVRWRWGIGIRSKNGSDYMNGWCNGSAGFVYLWTLAHKVFSEERYLALAEGAGWYSWKSTDSYGNLCCGLAGQAYALLNLYRYTHENAWLKRAEKLANLAAFAVRDPARRHDDGYVNSLYKGEVGVALLAADLARPELSCMPFFEGEGWPSCAAPRNSEGGFALVV